MTKRPAFQITIDTEGDNLWSRPAQVTTRNAQYLPRFQSLCERYGLKPTYLVNWEMANSLAFQEFGHDVLKRGTAELGMHLHAWDTPPIIPLTHNDCDQHPYLIEYPKDVMREKIKVMTLTLEQIFQTKMLSHRAGRWAFNETYAEMLFELEYLADCSVTPHVSWTHAKGASGGGSDYTLAPEAPHEYGGLVEIPMSIIQQVPSLPTRVLRRATKRPALRTMWLRPTGRNAKDMQSVLQQAGHDGKDYVQFMLHSSEFMPGGSPTFNTATKIETLYVHLEKLFASAVEGFSGGTLSEYAQSWRSQPRQPGATTGGSTG